VEEIILDLNKVKRGIEEAMPYIDGTEVHDKIHSFKAGKPWITKKDINEAISEIDRKEFSWFIGLISHLVYWSVFGHIN